MVERKGREGREEILVFFAAFAAFAFNRDVRRCGTAYCLNSLNGSWQSCFRRKLRNRL